MGTETLHQHMRGADLLAGPNVGLEAWQAEEPSTRADGNNGASKQRGSVEGTMRGVVLLEGLVLRIGPPLAMIGCRARWWLGKTHPSGSLSATA